MTLAKGAYIQELLGVSGYLEKLAEKLVAEVEDPASLRLYGTILDSAYQLRVAAEKMLLVSGGNGQGKETSKPKQPN